MPSWIWLEATAALFGVFFVVAIVVAVFTRLRENEWNNERDLDGRRVRITVLSSIWPCVAVDVDANVPRRELRARRKRTRESEKVLRKIVRVSHVESSGETVRVVVRPLPLSIRSYDLVRDVVPYVLALEAAAHDGEGGPAGAPIAVRATG